MSQGMIIQDWIANVKIDNESKGRKCEHLILSNPVYRLLKQELYELTGVSTDSEVEKYNGMKVINVDRDDITLIIG